jgi:hypothetical protein
MRSCTYCGADITLHEPVYVQEPEDGERVTTGQFCNYACLLQHIEEADLTLGASCRIDCC